MAYDSNFDQYTSEELHLLAKGAKDELDLRSRVKGYQLTAAALKDKKPDDYEYIVFHTNVHHFDVTAKFRCVTNDKLTIPLAYVTQMLEAFVRSYEVKDDADV